MSKIRVIDLLNKIANAEEAPKRVKFSNIIWNYDEKEKTYFMNNTEIELFYIEKITKKLNDEVEIIQEEPGIDIQGIEEIKSPYAYKFGDDISDDTTETVNMLIKTVKQLDKRINNK